MDRWRSDYIPAFLFYMMEVSTKSKCSRSCVNIWFEVHMISFSCLNSKRLSKLGFCLNQGLVCIVIIKVDDSNARYSTCYNADILWHVAIKPLLYLPYERLPCHVCHPL